MDLKTKRWNFQEIKCVQIFCKKSWGIHLKIRVKRRKETSSKFLRRQRIY